MDGRASLLRDRRNTARRGRATAERLRRRRVPVADRAVANAAVLAPSHDLPLQAHSLIGRDEEVARLRQLLTGTGGRLVTLTGSPGVGKTRLAREVARTMAESFTDGVFFIDLTPLSDPDLVRGTVAGALGLTVGAASPIDVLRRALHDRDALIVLDNFEQVLGAGPRLNEILEGCTYVRILVTSRTRLGSRWETVHPVPPLAVPDLGRLPAAAALARVASVALFLERARNGATLLDDDRSRRAVAEICVRLDGLPLAIELAAARTTILPPQAILARLGRRFDLLVGTSGDRPERQRSLRAAIDWRWEHLSEAERGVLRRLAVFVGGASLEAAEAVCAQSGAPPVLDTLEALVDGGLMQAETDSDAAPRLRMLETIREYALEQLAASGELEAVRRRHAAFMLARAERIAPELRGPLQRAAFDELEREQDNVRAALRWTIDTGEAEFAARLAIATSHFWEHQSDILEGWQWSSMLVRLLPSDPTPLRARLLLRASAFSRAFASTETIGFGREALRHFRALDHDRGVGDALFVLSRELEVRGEHAEAATLLAECLDVERRIADPLGLADALNLAGEMARHRGKHRRARALYEESLALFRRSGDLRAVSAVLHNLGHVALRQLDPRADDLFGESLRIARDLDTHAITGFCVAGLAGVALAVGRPERAARLLGAATAMLEAHSWLMNPADRAAYGRTLSATRAQLGDARYLELCAEGREMSREEALDHAMEPIAGEGSPPTEGAARSPLTPREGEVAALVARGLTNRQIAHEMRTADGTARAHVEHILTKLGLHSRAQLAAWAVERGFASGGGA